jgi:hypothetical protein
LSCNYRDSLLSGSIRQEAGCFPNGGAAEKHYDGRIKGDTVKKGSAEFFPQIPFYYASWLPAALSLN